MELILLLFSHKKDESLNILDSSLFELMVSFSLLLLLHVDDSKLAKGGYLQIFAKASIIFDS